MGNNSKIKCDFCREEFEPGELESVYEFDGFGSLSEEEIDYDFPAFLCRDCLADYDEYLDFLDREQWSVNH